MHGVPQLLWVVTINDNNIIHNDSNEEECIESSGFCMPRPDIKYKGSFIGGGGGFIYSGLLSNIGYEDDTSNNDALGITTVDDNNKKWNNEEAEDTHTRKGEAHLILKIFAEAQRADLRRFDKHKKTPLVRNCTFFVVNKALKYGWVSIPY